MIAQQAACLDKATLAELMRGNLPGDRFSAALAHVDSCEHCSRLAENSLTSAAFSGLPALRQVAEMPQDAIEQEPECQAFVANLLFQAADSGAGNRPQPSSPAGAKPPCQTLGPYRLLRTIGVGGMGAVYLAEHQRLRRTVAIKLLPREKLDRDGWLDRFNREMTAIAALEHPNVVRAMDAGEENDWHYLVMEHLQGLDVSRVARRCGELSVQAACEVIRQAALGLEAIHQADLVHRDIKPSNLFLTATGDVKILDLGLVIGGQSPLASDGRLTTVGHLMGTLPYMPREQLNDPRSADARSDIYSLGATLFRLLVGKAPYGSGENLAKTIGAITNSAPPAVADFKRDLPTDLSNLVDRMLSPCADERPQSAREVADALSKFSSDVAAKSTIRAAMMISEQRDSDATGATAFPQLPFTQVQPTRGRWKWLVAAGIPMAFLAGIILMVQTDRGTLVIESDDPAVAVRVTQGDKLVERLRVESGEENSLWLRSGHYAVEIEGTESDAFEIAGEKVTLMRGDKHVVTITRRDEAERGLTDTKAPMPLGDVLSWASQDMLGFVQEASGDPFTVGWLPERATKLIPINDSRQLEEKAKGIRPSHSNVVVDVINDANLFQTRGFTTSEPRGVLFTRQDGAVLRWFGDVDGDSRLDLWVFFRGGLPVYCEVDTNQDGKADRYLLYENRRLVAQGTDEDGDLVADSWSGDRYLPFLTDRETVNLKQPVRRFENQPLSYWLRILETDRDMATLSKAMQAVGLLAETPDERLRAAKQMLIPARQLGGLVVGGRGGGTTASGFTPIQTDSDLSGWFMSELLAWFPRTFPDAGLRAICAELKNDGTRASKEACMLLLSNLNQGGTEYPPSYGFYQRIAESAEGRNLLSELNQILDLYLVACERETLESSSRRASMNQVAIGIGQENRAAISTVLGLDLRADAGIVRWATGLVEPQATNTHGYTWISSDVAGYVVHTLDEEDYPLGSVVPPLLRCSITNGSSERAFVAIQTLAKNRRDDLAAAILAFMKSMAESGGTYFGAPFEPIFVDVASGKTAESLAVEVLQSPKLDTLEVLTAIARIKSTLPEAFTGKQCEAAIDDLLVRTVLETDLDSDPNAYARIAYAARGIALRKSVSKEQANAVLAVLKDVAQPNQAFENYVAPLSPWPSSLDADFSESTIAKVWAVIPLDTFMEPIRSLAGQD